MKVSKDGVTFHEIEEDFDPETGKDRSLEAARAKGYKPFVDVTKDGKEVHTIEMSGTSLKAAFDKGYKTVDRVKSDAEAQVRFKQDIAKDYGDIGVTEAQNRSAMGGFLGNFADEAQGAVGAAKELVKGDTGVGTNYRAYRDAAREVEKVGAEKYPIETATANIVGSIASPINKLPGGVIAQAALGGFGASEEGSLKGMALDTLAGGGIGAAFAGAGKVAPKVIDAAKAVGKKAASMFSDLSPESVEYYLAKNQAVKNARPLTEVARDVVKGGEDLAGRVSGLSGQSYDILAEEGVEIPKPMLISLLKQKQQELIEGGQYTKYADADLKELDGLIKRLERGMVKADDVPEAIEGSDVLRGAQAKNWLKQIGDVAFPENPGAADITPALQRELQEVRGAADDFAKKQSPAYAQKMKEVQDAEMLRKSVAPSIRTPEASLNALKSVSRERRPYLAEDLAGMDKLNGTNLLEEAKASSIKDLFETRSTNGSRNVNLGGSVGESVSRDVTVGRALGAIVGYAKDSLARPATAKALDLAVAVKPLADRMGKYGQVLLEAAKKGPAQFYLTHELLTKQDPEYRALLND